jgi:hypothetical protein
MTNSETQITPTYLQEDIQEILHIAICRKQDNEEMTRQDLLDIAKDLGISPRDLELAEQQWNLQKQEADEKLVFNAYRQNRLKQNLIQFGIVNSFLILINLVIWHGIGFAAFVFLTWGLFLTLRAWKTYQLEGEDYEAAFKAWKLKKNVGKSINAFTDKVLKGLQS